MIPKSYTNLLDLKMGNIPVVPRERTGLQLVEDLAHGASTDNPSSDRPDRMIIVANQLPLKAEKQQDNGGWHFSWNEDSLYFQLKDGLPKDMVVSYVGSLNVDINPIEQNAVSQILWARFNCLPTFLPLDLHAKFYDGFCKRQLWPLFHSMLPFSPNQGGRFDPSLWEAYKEANQLFCQRVVEVINPDYDYVWIHDYHLLALPVILRTRFNRIRMGFYLHCPFPSFEIYRTLPVREEILRALLNADLIGFHTFDYAQNFLACCSWILDLVNQSTRGYLELEYYGRSVGIKIVPVGINIGRIQSVMKMADKESRIAEIRQQFKMKTVLLGVDNMDIFKGIDLKLQAFEKMLHQHPRWRGRAVLAQIVNPERDRGINLEETRHEIQESCRRINEKFGQPGYEPVVIIDRAVYITERIAYYNIAECVVVTAVRDGMNLIPYDYIASRHGLVASEPSLGFNGPEESMLVVSEFIGCSRSLSGAIRINPWNVEATAKAMEEAISMDYHEKKCRHKIHYWYINNHDAAYWARSFLQDLGRICSEHFKKKCIGMGLSFEFRVVALDPNFRRLSEACFIADFKRAKSRAILLDYDGTLVPQNSKKKAPTKEVISVLNALCGDLKTVIFIVSGRGRENLCEWFQPCKRLGTAAEHGYFLRWSQNEEWETCGQNSDFSWMQIIEPIMKCYTDVTESSSIERKECSLVWQYQFADPGFGSLKAKELLEHLGCVLANAPVSVKRGHCIVEVKPQGTSKGLVVEKILTSMAEQGKQADFVLCIGNDRSDEDMFEVIHNAMSTNILSANASVFACTVGQNPSKAKYYMDDTDHVISMLRSLALASEDSADYRQ